MCSSDIPAIPREHVYGAVAAADPAGGRQGPQRLLGSLMLEDHWISSFLRGHEPDGGMVINY